ncbi:hypothetical protein VKT23_007248 [Stygiomarasmius scandens]|uniref:Uncharacterized protein n=1 Tax=Marasmiellus scandens TaxID=2682957 RepID=A0ABR1JMI8_9AGAR
MSSTVKLLNFRSKQTISRLDHVRRLILNRDQARLDDEYSTKEDQDAWLAVAPFLRHLFNTLTHSTVDYPDADPLWVLSCRHMHWVFDELLYDYDLEWVPSLSSLTHVRTRTENFDLSRPLDVSGAQDAPMYLDPSKPSTSSSPKKKSRETTAKPSSFQSPNSRPSKPLPSKPVKESNTPGTFFPKSDLRLLLPTGTNPPSKPEPTRPAVEVKTVKKRPAVSETEEKPILKKPRPQPKPIKSALKTPTPDTKPVQRQSSRTIRVQAREKEQAAVQSRSNSITSDMELPSLSQPSPPKRSTRKTKKGKKPASRASSRAPSATPSIAESRDDDDSREIIAQGGFFQFKPDTPLQELFNRFKDVTRFEKDKDGRYFGLAAGQPVFTFTDGTEKFSVRAPLGTKVPTYLNVRTFLEASISGSFAFDEHCIHCALLWATCAPQGPYELRSGKLSMKKCNCCQRRRVACSSAFPLDTLVASKDLMAVYSKNSAIRVVQQIDEIMTSMKLRASLQTQANELMVMLATVNEHISFQQAKLRESVQDPTVLLSQLAQAQGTEFEITPSLLRQLSVAAGWDTNCFNEKMVLMQDTATGEFQVVPASAQAGFDVTSRSHDSIMSDPRNYDMDDVVAEEDLSQQASSSRRTLDEPKSTTSRAKTKSSSKKVKGRAVKKGKGKEKAREPTPEPSEIEDDGEEDESDSGEVESDESPSPVLPKSRKVTVEVPSRATRSKSRSKP